MSISIEIQKSGFPIKLGTVERWFDTSAESLTRFHDMETEATKRLNEFQRQIVESNIGKDIEEDNITIDTVKGAVDLEKKYLEIQYDLLLGDGTFAELYDLYPDYLVLQETLEKVSEMIAQKLEELAIEREKAAKVRISKYTKKTKVAPMKKK